MIKILYFGTSQPSAFLLETLATTQGFTVVGVVTQPDRPAGRNQQLLPVPVKLAAERLRLPVFQPENLKKFSLASLPPADIFVVFAYGSLLPKIFLDLPPHGTINVHPSLLPKYRGPTPVQSALIQGEEEMGVTIILLDEQMDHGPILNQIVVPISPAATAETATNTLVVAAVPTVLQTIRDWMEKKITPLIQDEAKATYCPLLTRDDGRINWRASATEIYNLYRGLTPWPGVWTTWQGKRLKLLRLKSVNRSISPGTIVAEAGQIFIGAGNGSVNVLELQREGKKTAPATEFLRGYKNFANASLF